MFNSWLCYARMRTSQDVFASVFFRRTKNEKRVGKGKKLQPETLMSFIARIFHIFVLASRTRTGVHKFSACTNVWRRQFVGLHLKYGSLTRVFFGRRCFYFFLLFFFSLSDLPRARSFIPYRFITHISLFTLIAIVYVCND